MREELRIVLRTPYEVVLAGRVRAARVPTETGHVGLRPGGEPLVLVVEPGLVLLRGTGGLHFAATAGGLLESGREACTLYTPVAVTGFSEDEVLTALGRLLAMPDRELAVRRQLGDLERRIVQELRERPQLMRRRRDDHERPAE